MMNPQAQFLCFSIPKRLSKAFSGSFFSVFIFVAIVATGCKPQPHRVEVHGPESTDGDPNDEKPTSAPPPYDLKQFQKGQWIVWKRTAPSQQPQCVRWTWVTVGENQNLHRILGDYSPSADCDQWPEDKVRLIEYDPRTGVVETDQITTGDGRQKKPATPLETIYLHLYGRKDKVKFSELSYSAPEQKKVPAFQLKGAPEFYVHQPGDPFHGVVLKWSEKDGGLQWQYHFFESKPELPVLPTEADPNS